MRFPVTLSVTNRNLLRNLMNCLGFQKTPRCYILVNFPA
jgi:hypothetical protein